MLTTRPGLHEPRTNHLLAALPADVLARLEPHLVPRHSDQGDVLLRAGEPVEQVYFPTGGLFSLLVLSEDGAAVEAAVVGREGMLGSAVILGSPRSTFEEVCQVEDGALILPADLLREEMLADRAVHALLLRYAAALLEATARSVACNRLHTTERRMARWLLQVRDAVDADTFYLTQEFLGHMLAVRRPTVTQAAGELQAAGLIRYHRGRVRLMDQVGLEATACEDYRHIRDAYAELIPKGVASQTPNGRATKQPLSVL